MSSVNRWAIYCHFFGLAVNPRFFLPIFTTKGACFSANTYTIYCHFSSPNGTGNGLFWVSTGPGPTKFPGNKLKVTISAHFYTGVPPVSSRALRGRLSDRIRMRQTGRRGRCFRCAHRHLPLPPRAAARAPLCGYPMSKYDERGTTKENDKEETDDEENERRITERTDRRPAAA